MKKLIMIFILLLSLFLTGCEYTFKPLDYIHEYNITIDPNDDGTLDMNYYLKWEVLEEGNGGVDFITVGVPNRFVEDIDGLTANIDDIYYSSSDGATIRIDFKNTYHKGDIFEVEFNYKQKRIFTLSGEEIQYSFNPGWFNEIQVKNLTVLWNDTRALKNNADEVTSNYLKWETSLDYGETIEVNLVYNKNLFPNLDSSQDYSDQTENPLMIVIVLAVVFVCIFVFCVIAYSQQDQYQTCRGFSGHINHYHFYFGRHHGYRRSGKAITPPKVVNNSGSGVGGGGCACACACACAGGGRAGCSRKDFNNYLNIENIKQES